MNHKNYLSNNMSLLQLMKITGSVSLVTMLALSGRGVTEAQEVNELSTNRLSLEPININYNDTFFLIVINVNTIFSSNPSRRKRLF